MRSCPGTLRFIRRTGVVLIAALLATSGCTKAVDVPRDRFEMAGATPETTHRIRMKGNAEYTARWFSVTDSTLVITELSPADPNYRLLRPPIILPLDDVESVSRLESNDVVPIVIVGSVFVLLAVIESMGPWGFSD